MVMIIYSVQDIKSLENKTTITSSMSFTYLLRVALYLSPTRQRHENRLYMPLYSFIVIETIFT